MLNKDEYNQDEYNDYYRQETEGAEISGRGVKEDGGGLMGKLIGLLLLLALLIGGYFGYNAMNSSSSDDVDSSLQVSMESSLPQTMQDETEEPTADTPTKEEVVVKVEKEEVSTNEVKKDESKSVETAIASQVEKTVSSNGKMTPDQVASIVAAVMQQMNKEKATSATPESVTKKDSELMDTLSDTEVDSVSTDLVKELENMNLNEDTQIDNSKKQIDVYNKVSVEDTSGSDALSQLSQEINSVINEGVTEDTAANYTANITKEVATRKNEMRIIIVKKGDTLGKLAKRAYGNVMEYKKIYRANPEITRPDRIYIGQKIRIPK